MFDSGASYSVIRRDLAEQLEILTPLPDPENHVFETERIEYRKTAQRLQV
ncbi:MAG: hypothetical protein GVY29_02870 [Spirochaetes bacterium]|nr:hypothetical protein [Spirochaetota bacterium]